MFALRSLARTAPQSAVRLSRARAIAPSAWRTTPTALPAWAPAPRLAAAFHLSAVRRQDNAELVAKLQSEIAIEEDVKEDEDFSANIKEYLENSDFELEDKPGHQEVVLTRTYGDERIRVTFTTADLGNDATVAEDLAEDGAIYDEDGFETQSGGATSKGAVAQGRGADGNTRVAPGEQEESEEDYDEDGQQGFPAHANIRIERPGKGALAIEATAQDGDFIIENLYYFPSSDLADPPTAEQEWARRTLYTGPSFNNLDEDLQILLEKYLEERGINTRLALFIPDYLDLKEQKEYVTWLNKVKNFVE